MFAAILTLCGAMVFTSCSDSNDKETVTPVVPESGDGGNDDGRIEVEAGLTMPENRFETKVPATTDCDKSIIEALKAIDKAPNPKGKIILTRINDEYMENLLRNDPVDFERYRVTGKKSQHQPTGVTFCMSTGRLIVEGAEDGTAVSIYNLQGMCVGKTVISNGAISLDGLRKGVYAVQIGKVGSTLIRL